MKKIKPERKMIRLTLDVTEEFYERLGELERKTDAHSKAGLIRTALQLYEYFVIRTVDEGKEVIIRTPNPDENRESKLELYPLHALAASGRWGS